MPGAWEIQQSKQVYCAILHVDLVSVAWALGFRNLIIPGAVRVLAGMPYDMARNVACKEALDFGFQYCFFLDSDVIPPRDAILRLMARKLPFVSGMYCRRSPPAAVPVMLRNGQWLTNFVPGSMVEVDLVGAGCLLLHRSLLESLPPQRPQAGKAWFDWRVDCRGVLPDAECLSEDFTLCTHARKHGHKVYVDTSIRCRHVGLAEADFGTFVPCNANTVT